eukprot:SAG11_NODE_561_length_8524_cov_17.539466_3_plen_64_part_00
MNSTASSKRIQALLGRRVSGAQGSETVYDVDFGSLDPWGILVARRSTATDQRPLSANTDARQL